MKMKKIMYLAVIGLISIISSCNDAIGNEDSTVLVQPDKNKLVPLSIRTDLTATIMPTSRNSINVLSDTAKLGVFVSGGTKLNIPYLGQTYANILLTKRNNNFWNLQNTIYLSDKYACVYTYYPYNADHNDGTAIPIELATQTDYLYSPYASVNNLDPVAAVNMKHILCLLEFKIYKEANVPYEPVLQKILLTNDMKQRIHHNKATMNIETGQLAINTSSQSTASVELNYQVTEKIPANNSECPELLVMPFLAPVSYDGQIKLYFTINDKQFMYPLPLNTRFEGGKKYVYTVKLSAKTITASFSQVERWDERPSGTIDL